MHDTLCNLLAILEGKSRSLMFFHLFENKQTRFQEILFCLLVYYCFLLLPLFYFITLTFNSFIGKHYTFISFF